MKPLPAMRSKGGRPRPHGGAASPRPPLALRWMASGAAGLLLALAACSDAPAPFPAAPDVATGDLDAIARQGVLRLARRRWEGFDTLPRQGLPAERYRELAEAFAARHGLRVDWRTFDGFHELIPAVRDGLADVAVANITVTASRQREVAFTVPLTHSKEWVVGRAASAAPPSNSPRDGGAGLDGGAMDLAALATLSFGVPAQTAYVESLATHLPAAKVATLRAGMNPAEVLQAMEAGEFDATVMDAVAARPLLEASDSVRRLAELPETRQLAWAARRDNPLLLGALDAFLEEAHLGGSTVAAHRDLDAIEQTGRLRLLTLNGPATYYLWRGELIGFEYELVKAFADELGVALETVVAPHRAELQPLLEAGRGDLISASVTITDARRDAGLAFSEPYLKVQEVFVSQTPFAAIGDLAGRRVTVQAGTSFVETLQSLPAELGVEISLARATSPALIERVGRGLADVTLADSHVAEIEAAFDASLFIGPRLTPERELGWAVRQDQPQLLAALNRFIRERYRGYEYNVLRNKYFRNERRMRRQRDHRLEGERLSPYDDIVQRAADTHGFDWRLLVSQMYQESGFDPSAVSFADARGLMQVLPRTAREVGVAPEQLAQPEQGIVAGARYLAWTRDRFPALPLGERHWFALAAYNAGVGHVRDARRLAAAQGWDPARWFDNVEKAMLLLSERRYARQAVHGYVRGSEPVRYVSEIRHRYRAYVDHLALLQAREVAGEGVDTPG